MRAFAGYLAIVLAACTADIPLVEPDQFACDSDEPLAGGQLQCPESHWCDDGVCKPRLSCVEGGASRPGCDRDAQRRCDPVLNPLTTAVGCFGGNHTITSTIPRGDDCSCPDQGSAGTPLFCAHVPEGPSGEHPIFVTQPGEPLATGQFGITEDVPDFRWCVRVCANEIDCPASHTCRAGPVVTDQLRAAPSGRHTIGVCYPNYLIGTSTTIDLPQPDDDACLSNADCIGVRECQYNIEDVADHPVLPIGSSWDGRKALVARCVPRNATQRDPGGGCTGDPDCKNGICESGKCQRPCNPAFDTACDFCLPIRIERTVDGVELIDFIHLCENS